MIVRPNTFELLKQRHSVYNGYIFGENLHFNHIVIVLCHRHSAAVLQRQKVKL